MSLDMSEGSRWYIEDEDLFVDPSSSDFVGEPSNKRPKV